MKVPRPTGGSRQSNGVGKIYVKFDTPESAGKALRTLAGRKFADRTVVTTYFSEVSISTFTSFVYVLTSAARKTSRFRPGNLLKYPCSVRSNWQPSIDPESGPGPLHSGIKLSLYF